MPRKKTFKDWLNQNQSLNVFSWLFKNDPEAKNNSLVQSGSESYWSIEDYGQTTDTVHFICLAMIGSQRSDRIGLEIHPTV